MEFGGLRYPPYTKFSFAGGSGNIFATLLEVGPTIPVVNWAKVYTFMAVMGLLVGVLHAGIHEPTAQGYFSLATLGSGMVRIGEWLKQ